MPPVGGLEAPGLVADRAGEGAAHVPEQLRFEQVLGDGAAVDGDERACLARGERLCSSRAISSLPVPVSPVISTEMSVVATFWTLRKTSCMRGDEPRISPKRICSMRLVQRSVVELAAR